MRCDESSTGSWDLHDETSAAGGCVLNPYLTTMGSGVLGHQRQSEAGSSCSAPSGRATGEPLEDSRSLARSHTGPGVFDGDAYPTAGSLLECHRRRATTMQTRVVEEIGEDALQPAFVDIGRSIAARCEDYRQIVGTVTVGDTRDESDQIDVLAVEFGDADIESREFEEVEDHLIETPNLRDDDVESLLGALAEIGSTGVENLDRGGQRSDGAAKFV